MCVYSVRMPRGLPVETLDIDIGIHFFATLAYIMIYIIIITIKGYREFKYIR